MLSVIYAECHLCRLSFMPSVIYAECHLCRVSFMLSVADKPLLVSVIMLSVIILNVVAPFYAIVSHFHRRTDTLAYYRIHKLRIRNVLWYRPQVSMLQNFFFLSLATDGEAFCGIYE